MPAQPGLLWRAPRVLAWFTSTRLCDPALLAGGGTFLPGSTLLRDPDQESWRARRALQRAAETGFLTAIGTDAVTGKAETLRPEEWTNKALNYPATGEPAELELKICRRLGFEALDQTEISTVSDPGHLARRGPARSCRAAV
jgi:hypothetical protein